MVKTLPVMRETWVSFPDRGAPLEKGVAAHSSVLAWRTPGTGEPGGPQSMGLQRVRHDGGRPRALALTHREDMGVNFSPDGADGHTQPPPARESGLFPSAPKAPHRASTLPISSAAC